MIELPVAIVFIPSMLRPMVGDRSTVAVSGSTVREVVENLTLRYPSLRPRLLDKGQLRSSISVAVDGEISSLGLLDSLEEDSEVHFIPALAGGCGGPSAVSLG